MQRQFCIIICIFLAAIRFEASTPPHPIHDFLYQLQNLDLDAVSQTAFDLIIIDYSADGTEETEYSVNQINRLKTGPGGKKFVLAYMSIGEAEDYRFYWEDHWSPGNPSWLDSENPDWQGNYKVRYWETGWQDIIMEYTDRLLAAGFDGAYLDIIDAYGYFEDQGRTTAAQEMVDFVAAIRAHARPVNPDFLIFPQNAPELATIIRDYLNVIDGIGQEDIYYGYDADGEATTPDVSEELESYLNTFRDAGKYVLTIDYPFGDSEDEPHFDADTQNKIDDAYAKSSANGYIPYCTVRNLNYLTINPGHEPTGIRDLSIPENRLILHAYPNPFNPDVKIIYKMRTHSNASIKIYNARGREIATLMNEKQDPGTYSVSWNGQCEDGRQAPNGVYFIKLSVNCHSRSLKLTLLR